MPHARRTLAITAVLALFFAALWWFWARPDGEPASDAADDGGRGPSARAGTTRGDDDDDDLLAGAWPWQRAAATISGTVTTKGAGPIAGAEVCAWPTHPDAPSELLREPRCTTTSADGGYVLEGLLPIGAAIHASAPEHVPAVYEVTKRSTTIHLQPGEDRTGIDLALEPGGVRIAGIVHDLAGGVIEGALVSSESWSGGWNRRRARSLGRTDAEGRFALWVEPGQAHVTAQADGYSDGSRGGVAPGFTFELFLTPESVIVGKVVRADTKAPVEGARVSAPGDYSFSSGTGSAITDTDGRFRIDRLQPGSYHPKATTDDGHGATVESVHVGLSETSDEVTIELHPIASVRGTIVLAGPSGTPCEEGNIRLTSRGGKSESSWGRCEPDGTVVLRAVEPGEYDVEASCSGHVTNTVSEPLVVGTEAIEGLVWEVQPGVTARGVVVDEGGKPVPEATVYASAIVQGREGNAQSAFDRTGADGTFSLEGLVAGRYRVRASAEGLVAPKEEPELEIGEAGRDDVRLELHAGGTVKGRVVDQNGGAVAAASVRVVGGGWAWAQTADDGRFELETIEPGDYRVVADKAGSEGMRAPGQTDDDVHGEPVHVVAGETVEVELVVEAQSGTIRGRVLDTTGAPVSDAFIEHHRESDSAAAGEGQARQRVRWGSWGQKPVLTDDDGSFSLSELADGAYTVRAYRKGGGEAVAEHVAVGTASLELSIEDTGSIGGKVTIAGGGAPDTFSVTAGDRNAGVWERDRFYRTAGEFRLTELAAGSYEITVTSDHGDATTTVELGAGEDIDDVELELTARLTLRGRVVDLESGEPVAGMRVSAGTKRGGGGFRFTSKGDEPNITDDSGRFELENAPAGAIRLMVVPRAWDDPDYAFTRTVAEVPADATEYELPDIAIAKKRRSDEDDPSDLGLKIKQTPAGVDYEDFPVEVAFVRPDGPAARGGVKAGDVVVSVDGHDVTGTKRYLYESLTSVAIGTSVKLGLEGDRSATVVAGPLP